MLNEEKEVEPMPESGNSTKPVLYAVADEVRSELFQLGHRFESAIDMAKDACNYEAGTQVAFRIGEAYVYMRQCLAELRELERQLSSGLRGSNGI
ncbi:MAG TPA: hypothetical protein VFT06_00350 [Flavisolibacter sp.]|nr:hypothetical protein [Flavisolibacter sp.]